MVEYKPGQAKAPSKVLRLPSSQMIRCLQARYYKGCYDLNTSRDNISTGTPCLHHSKPWASLHKKHQTHQHTHA
eukprot:1157210-Pelagomonas_calceolata.AAC.10